MIIFGGHILPLDQEPDLSAAHQDFSMQVSEGFGIGPKYPDKLGPTDYVNHSGDPTCGIKGQIILAARRDILPGEEITFD